MVYLYYGWIFVKKRKFKKNNLIVLILLIISIIGLGSSFYKIIKWKKDSNNINKQIDEINKMVMIKESSNDDVSIKKQESKKEFNPYLDYVNMDLINVDFPKLKKINSNTKGWIKVNGTTINYPFVQAKDNKYYLNHAFDNSYNSGGWVFLDYRNNIDFSDKNTILYAHSKLDKTMFWSLRKVFSKKWQSDKNNYIIKLATEKDNTLWQVFSIYHIPTTSDYIQVYFDTLKEFTDWSTHLINRSFYQFNTSIKSNDKILTLSSCYSDDEKMVLHAKFIKKESR